MKENIWEVIKTTANKFEILKVIESQGAHIDIKK